MSNPNPPAPAPRWLVRFGLLALAGYAVMIGCYFSTTAAGSDSSGYLNSARLFAVGQLETTQRIPPEFGPLTPGERVQLTPLGFWPSFPGPDVHPTYPTGLPLHLALAGKLFGWTAGALFVGLFAALGAILLCYAIGRELGLEASLAAGAAAVLACCPVFLFTSVQPLSDTLATTWCLAAVFCALRTRRQTGWAAACGAAFAIAVLVRPTNLVLAPALVVLLGFDWRRLLLFGLSGIPGAIWLGFYNHALYGGVLDSGYGPVGEAFAASWGLPTAWHFFKWLALLLPGVFVALPFFALARRELRTRELLGLAAWFGVIVTPYAFYEISHQVWWCLRFILPAIPALILAGMFGVEALVRRFDAARAQRLRVIVTLALVVWAAILARFWTRQFFIMNTKMDERVYADICAAAREKCAPGTLVVSMATTGAVYFYTDFAVLRWDQIDAARFARCIALARQAGRPVCAIVFDWEEKDMRLRCPGEWTALATSRNATLYRLAAASAPAATK